MHLDDLDDETLDRLTDPAAPSTITRIDGAPMVPGENGLVEGEPANGDTPIEPEPKPHATVTTAQLQSATQTGLWSHENKSTQLWLNSAFPAAGRSEDALRADLALHGIAVG